MLTADRFSEFFEALYGYGPRAWQTRLLGSLLDDHRWPSAIVAPTGTGKSAVVDVHVFANALSAVGSGPRVPRRLAVCVNRRAIVDQHERRASDIAVKLRDAEKGILAEVRAALSSLVTRTDSPGESPLSVVNLRGGVSINREWLHDPGACSVIAVTPDMWGSRVLFRGYGSSSKAWPREAGLLAMDTALVLDEAHLNLQLSLLGSDVEKMSESASDVLGVPGLQFISTTATPGESSGTVIGVSSNDLEQDASLRAVACSPKPVTYVVSDQWSGKGKATARYVDELVSQANTVSENIAVHDDAAPTVGVVVNRVHTATLVAASLRKQHGDEAVVCWVGRMRPMDVDAMTQSREGLLEPRGHAATRFLVATQTVEVGVDLDWAGLVTELAPGSALAQRAGRVNRRGLREHASIVIVGPSESELAENLPYTQQELTEALAWVRQVEETDEGLTAWGAASLLRPPAAQARRPVFTHLFEPELELFAETSKAWFTEPELAFWLRDDLEPDEDPVSIVMRSSLPDDDAVAVDLVAKTPPVAEEMFPLDIGRAKKLVEYVLSADEKAEISTPSRVFVWADDVAQQLVDVSEIRPGSVLVLDACPLVLEGVLQPEPTPGARTPRCLWEPQPSLEGLMEDALLQRGTTADELLDLLGESEDPRADVEVVVGHPVEVFLGARDERDELLWAVVRLKSEVAQDPDIRQEYSPKLSPVSLTEHSEAVAGRVSQIATRVGVLQRWAGALHRAALMHDAGKADVRFQLNVLGGDGAQLLAKSGMSRAQILRQRRARSALPLGWRHEQVSAAVVWSDKTIPDADVVARLVGTSHGHGRPVFPHISDQLLADVDRDPMYTESVRAAILELFETGAGWQDVLAATEEKLGHWGIAYLEALLRAADAMASKEGS